MNNDVDDLKIREQFSPLSIGKCVGNIDIQTQFRSQILHNTYQYDKVTFMAASIHYTVKHMVTLVRTINQEL